MNKADGQLIAVKFTQKLTNSFTEAFAYDFQQIIGATATASGSETSYPASNAIDGSLTSWWHGTSGSGPWWYMVHLSAASCAQGFRFYCDFARTPTTFAFEGSNDGNNFTTLGTYSITKSWVAQWWEFTCSNSIAYLYYRVSISATDNSNVYFAEFQLKNKPVYNEQAFTVTGQEFTCSPQGSLITKMYSVDSVTPYDGDESSVLLAIKPTSRFASVIGNLTVAYDSAKGNLGGAGGQVAAFSAEFTPTDLIAKPHPHDPENIQISSVAATGTLTRVNYIQAQNAGEHVGISGITATGTLTHVNDL